MLLKRICFLKNIVYILILVAASLTQLNATSPTPPNIVMVFIDDMGWGDLGCYGNPDIKTPNIDRLASQGILFEQFYVASPICSHDRTIPGPS
jgi:hypothetical protein